MILVPFQEDAGTNIKVGLLECAWASSTLLSEITKILLEEVMGCLETGRKERPGATGVFLLFKNSQNCCFLWCCLNFFGVIKFCCFGFVGFCFLLFFDVVLFCVFNSFSEGFGGWLILKGSKRTLLGVEKNSRYVYTDMYIYMLFLDCGQFLYSSILFVDVNNGLYYCIVEVLTCVLIF